jgi:hypothetical protein
MKKEASPRELAEALNRTRYVSKFLKIAADNGMKTPNEGETDFNEKPGEGAEAKDEKAMAEADGQQLPPEPTGEEEGQLPPGEEQPYEDQYETPEEAGARAAKAFLGPNIYAAAQQGDPAAIDLIAKTAAAVAGQAAEKAQRELAMMQQQQAQEQEQMDAMQQQEMMMQQQQAQQEAQMQGRPGNEEAMADQVAGVPQQGQQPSQTPQNRPSPAFN